MPPEQERDAFAYAIWMVGNMDTPEDKAAWWADFSPVWERASKRVEEMSARGVVVGQGFEATELGVVKPQRPTWSDYLKGVVGGGVLFHMIDVTVLSFLGYPHLADTMYPIALPVFVWGMTTGGWFVYGDGKDISNVA